MDNDSEMLGRSSERILIADRSDLVDARKAARRVAAAVGFGDAALEEIVLVVCELGSNLVEHAGGGDLTLTPIEERNRVGLQIESTDSGPGIRDAEEAIGDGYSTTGSLGYGLGTVNRLMDELEIASGAGASPDGRTRLSGRTSPGTHIVAQRWLRPHPSPRVGRCPLDLGVATRPHPGMRLNGDAFVIKHAEGVALAAVIDGLGHGQYAHRAALKAREYVERHMEQDLTRLFRGVGRACRGTRGVVMAVARFQWSQGRLTFGSIGDIAARVFGSPEPVHFRIRRGILGSQAPQPVVTSHPWDPAGVLVLHSDGLSSRWRWSDFPGLVSRPATEAARHLLNRLAKDNDDATVVVVKGAEL
jgi:anti-sigma regulatory factor (Ser/Thr protein kinase)